MFKNVLASSAAALLVFAPIAAQAGTRAADAPVSLAPMARVGSPIGSAQQIAHRHEIWLILLFGGIAAGTILAINSSASSRSPGSGN